MSPNDPATLSTFAVKLTPGRFIIIAITTGSSAVLPLQLMRTTSNDDGNALKNSLQKCKHSSWASSEGITWVAQRGDEGGQGGGAQHKNDSLS